MALVPDTRIGVYQITAQIGSGGMGEAYRAHDTALDREVAIKVLPEAFATDPERLARFEREARTLAALNHPNIAQIYGLERSGSLSALVMVSRDGKRVTWGTTDGQDANVWVHDLGTTSAPRRLPGSNQVTPTAERAENAEKSITQGSQRSKELIGLCPSAISA